MQFWQNEPKSELTGRNLPAGFGLPEELKTPGRWCVEVSDEFTVL